MSTDAFFFFHMDPENRRGETSTQAHHQPAASTSSSSVVSSRARQQFLVEYSPKRARVVASPQQQIQGTTQTQAIHRWLATHRSYSYLPHSEAFLEHSSFSSESEAEDACSSTSDESSESDSEDDQIYMAPRRQHSTPSLSIAAPVASPAAAPRRARAWPLSAARPALPVVDRAEATAFTTMQDKSHWSDDEEELEEDEEEEPEWLGDDEDDLPQLDADSGAPASTSTRSLPIPIFSAPRTLSNPIMARPISRKARADFSDDERDSDRPECVDDDLDALWDSSYPSPQRRRTSRKMVQDGQSFWTPWISDYIAAQNTN